ncbi:MAG: hypothetical protein NVSMB25_01680 [Thermoleophilaceae bacterium]
MASAEQIVRDYFDALVRRDLDAMASHWSADGVEDIASVGILRGPVEIRDFHAGVLAALPDLEWVVERVTAGEEVVVVQWRNSGTFSGAPFQGIEPTGRRVELRGCDCFEVEEGAIARNTVYQDGLAFARAVGLVPAQDSAAERALYGAFNAATKLRGMLAK